RRLHRAWEHPTCTGVDASGGRCQGGARTHLEPTCVLALLLRGGLRLTQRVDCRRIEYGGDLPLDRRGLVGVRLAGGPGRGEHGAEGELVPGLLRRDLPDPAARSRGGENARTADDSGRRAE